MLWITTPANGLIQLELANEESEHKARYILID